MAKKAKTVTYVVCDGCGKPIENPRDGVIIHGNVYAATPDQGCGLIGNNFPEDDLIKPEVGMCDQVGETAYCLPCLVEYLTGGKKELVDKEEAPPDVGCC